MIVIDWNARELRGPRAFHRLSSLISEATPDVLFLCEARISKFHANLLKSKLNFLYCLCVDPIGSKGGLILY